MVVADAGSEVIYTFSKEDGRISSGADAALVREGTHTHTQKKGNNERREGAAAERTNGGPVLF